MRMSHLASIVFACSISLFSTLSFAQSPAEDGLCDALHGATPGLYGLCVAYWATQDNGKSDASSKILEKYTQKQTDTDPGMPGLCPCWTADELLSWETGVNGASCYQNNGSDESATGWYANGYNVQAYRDDAGSSTCSANVPSSDGPAIDRLVEGLDQNQTLSCINDALASAGRVDCE